MTKSITHPDDADIAANDDLAANDDPNHDHGDLVIDCGMCVMRRTSTCTDCMVTFLLDHGSASPDREWSMTTARHQTAHTPADDVDPALVFDLAEQRAMRTLMTVGLLPELRYQSGVRHR